MEQYTVETTGSVYNVSVHTCAAEDGIADEEALHMLATSRPYVRTTDFRTIDGVKRGEEENERCKERH